MTLYFYTFGTSTVVHSLEMDVSKSSLIEQLNETTRLAVTLTAPSAPALKIGMYTTYKGSDYYLIAEPSVTKVHNESYIIEADLESIAGLTKATILSNPIDKRTSFDYTATAREHLQLIADSLNLKLTNGGLKWAVGSVNCRNDVRHIKYDHVTAWAALQRIRETYKTDIAINGTTISLGIPSDKANALELSYGKDKGLLSGLERVKHSDAPTPSRLYVTGTKRNMGKGTLTLEPSQVLKIDDTGQIQRIVTPSSGRIYTTDTDGRYVEIYTTDTTTLRTEATYTNEEIYPSHVSKVTTVEKVRDHYEVNSDLDLDYNKQTIAGEQMQIVFQSGNLAGREFDAIYKSSTKRFIITPKEEDETTLPNDILCPKAGDRYIITGIELPQQYIAEAQKKLTDAAVTQLEELQNTRYSYKAEVDPVYLYNNRTAIADKLTVGKYVHLTDTQIAQGDPYIRITSKRTYLDRIYQPEIELSNEVEEYSFFERLKDSFIDIARIDRKGELVRINRQIDITMPKLINDKIKVGGRNLIVKDRYDPEPAETTENYLYRTLILSRKHTFVTGDWYTLSMDVQVPEGAKGLDAYNIFDSNGSINKYGGRGETLIVIHNGRNHITFRWGEAGNELSNAGLLLYRGFGYSERPQEFPKYSITTSNITLVKGTIGLESYEPAPEDFLGALDRATLELTKTFTNGLMNKLDKPKGGSYVLDADIPDRIKDKITSDKYLQELIKGDKGDKPILTLNDKYQLLADGVKVSDLSLKGGKGDKGDKPILTLNDKYQLLADGVKVSDLSLKGGKGDKGDKPILTLNDKYQLLADGVKVSDLSLKGRDGENPNPSDVADLIASSATYKQLITDGLPNEDRVKELASALDKQLKVGGRNLLRGGYYKKIIFRSDRNELVDRDIENKKITVIKTGYWNSWIWLSDLEDETTINLRKAIGEFTLSFSVRGRGTMNFEVVGDYHINQNNTQTFERTLTENWQRVSCPFTRSGESGSLFILYSDKSKIGDWVQFADDWKLERGNVATDWTPAPEDLLAELDKYIPLKQYNDDREEDKKELTTAKSKLTTDISNARSRADSAYDGAQKANAKIADANSEIKRINNEVVNQDTQLNAQGTQIIELKKNQLPEDVRKWLQHMGMLLAPDTEEQGSSVTLNGIRADHSIFLRFSDGKPSAMIGGSDAVLMAGVQGYGTDNLSARTEIYQDGSAKFGDVKLSDKTIALMPKSGLPLRVTAEEGTFIENFLANSKDDRNIAYEKSFVVVGKGKAQTYSFDVANNDTKLTITIPKLTSEVYQINQSVILTLDGVTLGSWHGDTKLIKEDTSGIVGGGVHFRKENTPLVVENLQFERYLNSGSHTLSISVTSTDTTDKATITKLTAHLYYDASQAETILTCNGFRAFGGQNRYFDIDRSKTYRDKGYFTRSNPYIARVKGGMRVDRLTLEQPLDAPGCVLAGGRVENGYVRASFGKYKNRRGDSEPKARFDNSDKIYSVYHSIDNTNYTPIVTSCAGQWGDVPQVIGVYAYRFDVRFINYNNELSVGWNFNYVCYKGD